jgi:hypothetical protein
MWLLQPPAFFPPPPHHASLPRDNVRDARPCPGASTSVSTTASISPADSPEDPNDLYFGDDNDELEAAEVEAAVVAELEQEKEEAEDSDDDLAFLDDLPGPEKKAAEQRALLASFQSVKDADELARARVQDEEDLRRALELSVQRVLTEEAGRRFFADERQHLLEDATERRALFAGIRRMQRAVASVEQRKREGGDARAGPSIAPEGRRVG